MKAQHVEHMPRVAGWQHITDYGSVRPFGNF